MTLASIPRYDPEGVTQRSGRAVVIGASVAGLFAARVLTDAYESVVVVERDRLPDEAAHRRGVPQGLQPHFLLEAGRATAMDLVPDLGERLLGAGGLVLDWSNDLTFFDKGGALAPTSHRLHIYAASRPLLERSIREGVLDRESIAVSDGVQFVEYTWSDSGDRVTGVRVRTDGEESAIQADCVVDATGRTSRTPSLLEERGFPPPRVETVTVDMAYATVVVDRPPEDRRLLLSLPSPPTPRGGGVFPVEDGRWLVTLQGLHGDHPSTDRDDYLEFATSLPGPPIASIAAERDWLTDVNLHPFPSAVRRRYGDLERFPDGLLVIGDAIASFNPIYGQGMSVAALEALALHHLLAECQQTPHPDRYFEAVADIVDTAWLLSVGRDFAFEATSGPKPRGTEIINRYLDRVISAGHENGRVAERLGRVLMLDRRPRSLVTPRMLWHAVRGR